MEIKPEVEKLQEQLNVSQLKIKALEGHLETINNIMWNSWGIKDFPFGREDGRKIMEVLNKWAKQ